MSRFCEVKTIFKDSASLICALVETGNWTTDQIEIYDDPVGLYGYRGDMRNEKANIIIRRKHVGKASNDIGFAKDENGHYNAIISEYDARKYSDQWLGQLKTNYVFHKLSRDQIQRDRTINREKLSNGRQRITITGYR